MRPATIQEAATLLRGLERPVRPVGGGTKPWIAARDEEPLETGGLDRIVEHNVGDFTAVLEAGVPFAEAQAAFAAHGQRLSWDPPDPGGATIGGIVATADSGPLRHRYGGVRDLVVGTTVVLSDGTVAKSGGKVIKNVAGYDLAKLFAGSFGTLGLIATVSVRLHPLPEKTATVVEAFEDPDALLARVLELARRPLEADCFDVVWSGGSGRILLQFSGASAVEQAERIGAADRGRLGRGARAAALRRRGPEGLRAPDRPAGRDPRRRRRHRRLARRARALVDRVRAGRRPRRARRRPPARRSPRAPAPCSTAPSAGRGPVARPRPVAGRDGAPQGALRPRPDLPAGRLRRRNMSAAWDTTTPPPDPELIKDCVHCGFCLPTCPSYAVFEDEMDSPRGRIVLMRVGHEEGETISPEMVTHFDRCLGCMACVTACPSGVQYDKLIERSGRRSSARRRARRASARTGRRSSRS